MVAFGARGRFLSPAEGAQQVEFVIAFRAPVFVDRHPLLLSLMVRLTRSYVKPDGAHMYLCSKIDEHPADFSRCLKDFWAIVVDGINLIIRVWWF